MLWAFHHQPFLTPAVKYCCSSKLVLSILKFTFHQQHLWHLKVIAAEHIRLLMCISTCACHVTVTWQAVTAVCRSYGFWDRGASCCSEYRTCTDLLWYYEVGYCLIKTVCLYIVMWPVLQPSPSHAKGKCQSFFPSFEATYHWLRLTMRASCCSGGETKDDTAYLYRLGSCVSKFGFSSHIFLLLEEEKGYFTMYLRLFSSHHISSLSYYSSVKMNLPLRKL